MLGRGLGDMYAVFVLPLEREFGWSRSQVTGVYSVYLLVNGFTAPLVGLAFDRLGPRWVYAAGTTCLGAAFLLASQLVSLWQFYALIGALVGMGVSLNGMVSGSALLVRWYRARLSRAIGIAFSATGAGTLVFVPLAQVLVAEYDWRTAYRTFGIALLVIVPAVFLLIPWKVFAAGHPDIAAGKKGGEGGWTLRQAAGDRVYWALAQVFFCTATAMFAVVVQLVAFFIDVGYSPFAAATAFGALGMLATASIMGSGFVTERFGYRQAVTASFIGTGTGLVVLLAITAVPIMALLVLFVVAFGLCMGFRGPIISSICARHFAGGNVATIYGTIYSFNALGAAFGSWTGGVLHDLSGGYRAVFAFSIAFVFLAVAPFWTVKALRDFR